MDRLLQKQSNLKQRKARIRSTVIGDADRPRLSVSISNRHVSAQLIDDASHSTIAYVTTVGKKISSKTLSDKAAWVGSELAKKAKASKVKKVVLDRNGRIYHGRIKALAMAARAEGLEF